MQNQIDELKPLILENARCGKDLAENLSKAIKVIAGLTKRVQALEVVKPAGIKLVDSASDEVQGHL